MLRSARRGSGSDRVLERHMDKPPFGTTTRAKAEPEVVGNGSPASIYPAPELSIVVGRPAAAICGQTRCARNRVPVGRAGRPLAGWDRTQRGGVESRDPCRRKSRKQGHLDAARRRTRAETLLPDKAGQPARPKEANGRWTSPTRAWRAAHTARRQIRPLEPGRRTPANPFVFARRRCRASLLSTSHARRPSYDEPRLFRIVKTTRSNSSL
jgi:hypothetical protein